jgi:excisionase family DNA binding protein
MSEEKSEKMISAREVADRLGMSASTIRGFADGGKIPAYRVGGSWRFLWSEIKAKLCLRSPAELEAAAR